MKGRLHSRM